MIKGNTSIVGEAELRLKLVYAGIIMLDVNTKLVPKRTKLAGIELIQLIVVRSFFITDDSGI